MKRSQRAIFFTIHFGWIALWITAIDLEGKVSYHLSDLLFGSAITVAVASTIGMLILLNIRRKNR